LWLGLLGWRYEMTLSMVTLVVQDPVSPRAKLNRPRTTTQLDKKFIIMVWFFFCNSSSLWKSR
jgi:hypothetical protein